MSDLTDVFAQKEDYYFQDLLDLVRLLRASDGCPWDREQTHQSIRRNLLEEAYEVAEGIDSDDAAILREELGDYLFQAAFHIVLEEERGRFSAADVLGDICRKMVRRHPHVFDRKRVEEAGEVPALWESVKQKEKQQKSVTDAMLSIPRTLPALMYATKVETKAARAGFTYDSHEEAAQKVREEWAELAEAQTLDARREEYGDLLLALVNYGRLWGLDAEECLTAATQKFIHRFAKAETILHEKTNNLSKCTKESWILAWKTAKHSE